jgi:hypothetical protein
VAHGVYEWQISEKIIYKKGAESVRSHLRETARKNGDYILRAFAAYMDCHQPIILRFVGEISRLFPFHTFISLLVFRRIR